MVVLGRLCLCMCLVWGAAVGAQESEIRTLAFQADLAVDAEGNPVIGEIEGLSGRLADIVRDRLSRMSYVPAEPGGTPVSSTTRVHGALVLTPLEGDRFDARLEKVAAGPWPVRRAPIPYPPSLARARVSGHAEVLLTLDGSGNVTAASTVSSSHKAFRDAAIGSLRRWKFEPVSPAPVQISVNAVFHVAEQEPPRVEFECRMDPARVHVSGQSGCVDHLTVRGSIGW